MIYSRFLWLLLLLFWAFLAPMQSGYLYKAPSFCIYKKKTTLNRFISKSTSRRVRTESSDFLPYNDSFFDNTTVLFKCFHSELFGGFDTQDKHDMLYSFNLWLIYFFFNSIFRPVWRYGWRTFYQVFWRCSKSAGGVVFLGKINA